MDRQTDNTERRVSDIYRSVSSHGRTCPKVTLAEAGVRRAGAGPAPRHWRLLPFLAALGVHVVSVLGTFTRLSARRCPL